MHCYLVVILVPGIEKFALIALRFSRLNCSRDSSFPAHSAKTKLAVGLDEREDFLSLNGHIFFGE
jgi:hypothetical protein